MGRRRNWIFSSVLQVALLAIIIPAAAAQERERVRVVVEKFMGSKANRIRSYTVIALSKQNEIELVPIKEVAETLTRLGITLDSKQDYVAVSQALRVNVFVDGQVTRNANGWTASLWVRQGNGKFIGQHKWEKKKLRRLAVIKTTLWDNLGEAILGARVGQPDSTGEQAPHQKDLPTPADSQMPNLNNGVVASEEIAESPSVEADTERFPTALKVDLGLGANWRNNSYLPDGVEQPFHYYNEFLQPSSWLAIRAKWFPAAHFHDRWFAHIGLAADFGIGLGVNSTYEESESEPSVEPGTNSFAFSAGLLGRIPIEPIELGLTVAYGQRVFKTSGFDGLPDVEHGFLRLGTSGGVSVAGDLGVDLAIAYLLRLNSGEISSDDFFSEMSGGGIEAGIGVSYKVIHWLSIRADWSVQYFFFDTKSGDAFEDVTGGDDGFYTITIGVGYELATMQ